MVTIRPASTPVDHDVIVAGAGPAGAATAAHLAAAGRDVLLVDQRQFPRDKVCGDFVGPSAIVELEQLGVAARDEYVRTNEIGRAAVHVDGRLITEQHLPQIGELPATGRVIPRETLDAWIVDAALSKGASLLEGARLTGFYTAQDAVRVQLAGKGKSTTRELSARLVVGADGSTSAVAKALRGQPTPSRDRILAVRAYYEDVPAPEDRADLFFSGDSFPGYTWVFPTGGGHANAGVGMVLDTVPTNHEHLRDLLMRLVAQDRALGERLAGSRLTGRVVGWPLTTFNPSVPLVSDRVLLVGDAAGLINPLNGEGIQYALQSARWAAETISPCLETGDMSTRGLAPYASRVHSELRCDMAFAGMVVRLIRNRDLNPVWMTALRAIGARANRDRRYAALAGGVLAGLVPANRALSARMVAGTVAGAVSTASRPDGLLASGMDMARAGFTVTYDAAWDPAAFGQWLRSVACGALDLGKGVTRLTGVPSPNPKPRQRSHKSRSTM